MYYCARYPLPRTALSGSLSHVSTIKSKSPDTVKDAEPEATSVVSLGTGLPPVPKKLVTRIQAGEYVDMSELLPDRLGISAGPVAKDDKQSNKPKRRQVTNILEWIQCFGIYTAVLNLKHPDRIQDLLGYQALIVEACTEYNCEAWLGYDRRFRQNAAASTSTVWAKIDATLWNKAFTGQARAQRCQYCFSLTHKSEECDWADNTSTPRVPKATPVTSAPTLSRPGPSQPRQTRVCYAWNHSPEPNCPYPSCAYQHICLYCANDNQAMYKDHKALYCKRRRGSGIGSYPRSPASRNQQGRAYRYQPY